METFIDPKKQPGDPKDHSADWKAKVPPERYRIELIVEFNPVAARITWVISLRIAGGTNSLQLWPN